MHSAKAPTDPTTIAIGFKFRVGAPSTSALVGFAEVEGTSVRFGRSGSKPWSALKLVPVMLSAMVVEVRVVPPIETVTFGRTGGLVVGLPGSVEVPSVTDVDDDVVMGAAGVVLPVVGAIVLLLVVVAGPTSMALESGANRNN